MYMREMGNVDLLTREGEIAIAKRIEEGIRDVLAALARLPKVVEHILDVYARVSKEGQLFNLFVGYLDPTDHVPRPPQVAAPKAAPAPAPTKDAEAKPAQKAADGKDDASARTSKAEASTSTTSTTTPEKGPNPVEAKRRFTALKRQFNKTQKAISERGRASRESRAQIVNLGKKFQSLKLTPKHYDEIVGWARSDLAQVRRHERAIVALASAKPVCPGSCFVRCSSARRSTSHG